jgi:hypothetical protein
MGDDLFSMLGSAPSPDEEEEQPNQGPAADGGLSSMLADNDDDMFDAPPPPPQDGFDSPAGPPSALIEWRRSKELELQEKDANDENESGRRREAGQEKLHKFREDIVEASQQRAQHNAELDRQKVASLTDDSLNQWERIVALIDLNRPGSQTKDVSGFKKLLIQLKTKPPTKG